MNTFNLADFLHIKINFCKQISIIVTSTKEVKEDCVLLCVNGKQYNPEDFIDEEIEKKCAMIISNNKDTKYIYISDLKEKVFAILYFFYFPFKKNFKIIAITGTEGKSSLCDLIYQALKLLNYKCLLISTEQKYDDVVLSDLTTPPAYNLINAMLQAEKEEYDYLILEASSIGISEFRIKPEICDYIFLTNLNVDHLDYHHSIEAYHFSKINFLRKNNEIKFVLKSTYLKYPTYFSTINNLRVIDDENVKIINSTLKNQEFIYHNLLFKTNLLFKQNILNILFIYELLKELKIENPHLILSRLKRVKGRLDLVSYNPYILIDYVHSIKSMEMLLKQVSEMKFDNIILIFGAGGNRDKSKRKEYGRIALKYATIRIICNDNPREEDALSIANEIIDEHENDFKIILERKKAIEYGIKMAKINDIVLIIGRGNEKYQIINGKKIALNDYDIVNTIIKKSSD